MHSHGEILQVEGLIQRLSAVEDACNRAESAWRKRGGTARLSAADNSKFQTLEDSTCRWKVPPASLGPNVLLLSGRSHRN
jgi:hypothetical protein